MPSLAQTAKLSRHSKECPAPVAQRIEHLTTDQKVGGSNPSGRATVAAFDTGLFEGETLA